MESSFMHGILACLYRDPEDYLWYDEFTREPAQGCYRNHFANEMVEEETHFNQGRGIGIHRKWWPDGSLRFEKHLTNGFLNGKSVHWHFNGQISSKSYWKAGANHGSYETWWENGNPRCKQHWHNGELLKETYFREEGTQIL